MESNQETSKAGPTETENSVCPPSGKRQRRLSSKDGDQPKNKREKTSKRALPKCIRHFDVQCETCEKWRLIPSKKQYELIRQHIEKEPFVCEKAREWKPDVTCNDPPDVCQDGSKLWAIDEPNVATPQGWERLVKLRNVGGAYVYLKDNPKCGPKGVNASQFSFTIPKILEQDVRKHPQESQSNVSDTG